MCMLNGMCQSFISLNAEGEIRKTCNPNKGGLIGDINDPEIYSKIMKYIHKPLKIKKNSLFSLIGDKEYIYFQGDGCIYRKSARSNDDFLGGMADYIKEKNLS